MHPIVFYMLVTEAMAEQDRQAARRRLALEAARARGPWPSAGTKCSRAPWPANLWRHLRERAPGRDPVQPRPAGLGRAMPGAAASPPELERLGSVR